MLLGGLLAAGCASTGWPSRSTAPARPLGLPTLEAKVKQLSPPVDRGYQFVVFGDQRALADGEWQQMMEHIGDLAQREPRLLFMLDTGDIVKDGRHSDQFARLEQILSPASSLPYLVAVGNHEVKNNTSRDNTAAVLSYLDPEFSADRMYYRKDIGPVRFLFLDTNDFVYGDRGRGRSFQRAERQVQWLVRELDGDRRGPEAITVVVMHHPFVLSGSKHRKQSLLLWNRPWAGRYLPELLIDSGVDVVLTGHTHTFERFLLEKDGRRMQVLNISGRPRGFHGRARRARDISGREVERLRAVGFRRLDGWSISQQDAMPHEREADQFALITVGSGGEMQAELCYLDASSADGLRWDQAVSLE
jgi:hypothetical protein